MYNSFVATEGVHSYTSGYRSDMGAKGWGSWARPVLPSPLGYGDDDELEYGDWVFQFYDLSDLERWVLLRLYAILTAAPQR